MRKKINKNLKLILFLIMLSTILQSCDDIISKNISKEIPILILPTVNDTIESNPVQFKWEKINGATKYHLQVVQPNFSNINAYVLDTIITGTDFFIDLDSNSYQYRLTAINAGYESKTSNTRSFFVGTSQGSSSNSVTLIQPLNNTYVNENFNGVFSWYGLNGSSSYTFELHNTASFSGATLEYLDQIGTTNITSTNGLQLEEGVYSWGVKAFLSSGFETNFTKRVFYVDTVNPMQATPSSPLNNANVNAGNITFSWTEPTNTGLIQSPIISILEISITSDFSSLLTPLNIQGNTANYNLTTGTYYWRVRTKDLAGNWGNTPSNYRTIQVL